MPIDEKLLSELMPDSVREETKGEKSKPFSMTFDDLTPPKQPEHMIKFHWFNLTFISTSISGESTNYSSSMYYNTKKRVNALAIEECAARLSPNPNPKVLLSVSYLGWMTKNEFNAIA